MSAERRQSLRNFIEIMDRMDSVNKREGWVYRNPHHFLLEHGTEFLSRPLPPDGFAAVRAAVNLMTDRRLRVRECFRNAADVVLADHSGRLQYCEGFALRLIPCHHAWVVLDGELVADVTWNRRSKPLGSMSLNSKILGEFDSEECAYLGVTFSRERLRRQLLDTEVYGSLLMDHERGYPLYRSRFDAAKEMSK